MAHVSAGIGTCDDSVFESDCECAWPPLADGSVEPGGHVGSHRNDEMVPVSTTSDFLLADARAALRRRLTESRRTELSRAFAAWLLREPETDAEFASLVSEAATREGAQQDFQTVAILGFGADAGILSAAQIEVLKKGLLRQTGREVVIDGLPVAFCSDAVGILGIALGTKAVADADLTGRVVKWASKFLKNSYDTERSEDWQRSLFAVVRQQLGSSLNLSFPQSAATADVRTALVARGLIETGGDNQVEEDEAHTLRLAIREPQNELNCDRAALRLAAVESVIGAAMPSSGGNKAARAAKRSSPLSARDQQIHDMVGGERFRTLTNAEIMKEAGMKKRLRLDFGLESGDATKRCFDRIRHANGYPLSREIAKKRATRK
jgi:hypothetical protein